MLRSFLLWALGIATSAYAGDVTISLWDGYPEYKPVWEKAARDYEEAHPGIKVRLEFFPLREFERKLCVALPAGAGPDVFRSGLPYMLRFIEAGLISRPPERVVEFVRKAYPEWMVECVTHKGRIYAVPIGGGIKMLFWNKRMFREAGLERPPTTWDELIEYARKLTKYDEKGNVIRSGISLRLSGGGSGIAEKWWIFLLQAGGTILEETPSGKFHNGYDNQAGRDALKLYIDLLYKYKVDSFDIKHDAEAFALEQTAMFIREAWVIGYMKEHAPHVEYGTAPLPRFRRAANMGGTDAFWVAGYSENKDLAWDFILWLNRKEYLKEVIRKVGWVTIRKDMDLSDILEEIPQLRPAVEIPPDLYAPPYPRAKCVDEVYTRLAARLERAYRDKSLLDNPEGIARVIREAAEETDRILKEWGEYGTE